MSLLCEDLTRARENRTIIKRHYYILGYKKHEKLRERWLWGQPPPKKLSLGELPYIDRQAIKLADD